MSYKNIAVIGATGAVGQPVIDALLESSDHPFSITVITATPSNDPKFNDFKSKGIKIVQVDLDNKDQLVGAFKGIDVIVSTIAGHAIEKQILFIDAAAEAGVKRFLPSEFGVESFGNTKNEPFFDDKRRVQARLVEAYAKHNLTYTLIATGSFIDWGLTNGFLGFDLKNHQVTLYDDGKNLLTFTLLKDVGRFIVATLKNPEASKNRSLHLGGFTVNQLQILESLEKRTGVKWTVKESIPTSEFGKRAAAALEKHDHYGYAVNSILKPLFDGRTGFKTLENSEFPSVKPHNLEESLDIILKK